MRIKMISKLSILSAFLVSCIPLATNGTPVTTPKDELSVGIGLGGGIVSFSPDGAAPLLVLPTVSVRYGLSENTDIGFSGYPIFGILNTDIKFRFSPYAALISGIGFSYLYIGDDIDIGILSIVPNFGLGFGNERFYISPRFIYFVSSTRDTTIFSPLILQTSFGLTLGKFIKFNPEMGFYIPLEGKSSAFYFSFGVFYMPSR